METNAQPQKPLNMRMALRGAAAGFVGGIVGLFAAGPILSLFETSPEWLAPVVIGGFVAVFVMAVLLVPLVLHSRTDK